MHEGWKSMKWRPVVSYSKHHLKNLLGLAGRWASFTTNALSLGDFANDPREVTEDVHRFNEKMRSDEDWAEHRKKENAEKTRRARRNRNERRRWVHLKEKRTLRMRIMDLKSFFIKVPRDLFAQKAMPDIMRRLNEKYPGKSFF